MHVKRVVSGGHARSGAGHGAGRADRLCDFVKGKNLTLRITDRSERRGFFSDAKNICVKL